MRIQPDELYQQYKKLSYIQEITPGRLNWYRVLLCLVLALLTAGVPFFLFWKWQRFKNFINIFVFVSVERDSNQISYYLVVDSKKFRGKSRSIAYQNHILSPYHTQLILENTIDSDSAQHSVCKFLEHKHLKYVIKNDTLFSLKYKINRNIQNYLAEGLSKQQLQKNNQIYGKSNTLSIGFYHIFKKILHQKRFTLAFMFLAVKKIGWGFVSQQDQVDKIGEEIVSIVIIIEIIMALLIMLCLSLYGAKQHNAIHNQIQNEMKYNVIREESVQEKGLLQLSVGDVVKLQNNRIIYFDGILITNISNDKNPYIIVNEKLNNRLDKVVKKTPMKNSKTQVDQFSMIKAGTQILNMGFSEKKNPISQNSEYQPSSVHQSNKLLDRNEIKEKMARQQQLRHSLLIHQDPSFFLIVTDNNSIQKFYQAYQETSYFKNISSIRFNYDLHQSVFQGFLFALALIGTIYVSKDQKTHEHWISLLFSNLILCFPFNLALFYNINDAISVLRLKSKSVSVINPIIEQIGLIDNVSLELSLFETTQFLGFIKKQMCFGLPKPQRYDGRINIFETHKKFKEDSIVAFLGWIGIIASKKFEEAPIYKELFKSFEFEQKIDLYNSGENKNKRVINKNTSVVDWQEVQRFQINDKLIESIIIEDFSNDTYFSITYGEEINQDFQQLLYQIIEERDNIHQYIDILRKIHTQGKRVKYICLKRLKQRQRGLQSDLYSRDSIEKNATFAGFLVFDQWPTTQNLKKLLELDNIQTIRAEAQFNLNIYSVKEQNELIGYDHILKSRRLFYQASSISRALENYFNRADCKGTLGVGHGIVDQGALLAADISINLVTPSYGQADFQIRKPGSVLDILYQGTWSLYSATLTLVCLVLFNFSKIVGQLVLFEGDQYNKLQAQPLSASVDRLIILDFGALILPIILLNLYQPAEKVVKKEKNHFFKIELMFRVFISLMGLASLYAIEFLGHGFEGACSIYQKGFQQRHQLLLRHKIHQLFNHSKGHTCEGITNFLTISFAFLVILLCDQESPERKPRQIFCNQKGEHIANLIGGYLIGFVNKIYMFVVWIVSSFYFKVPFSNFLKSAVVIALLAILVYLTDFARKYKRQNQNQTEI